MSNYSIQYADDPEVTWQKAISSILQPGTDVELTMAGSSMSIRGTVIKCAAIVIELRMEGDEDHVFVRQRNIDAFRVEPRAVPAEAVL